jgi:hypothetical protein
LRSEIILSFYPLEGWVGLRAEPLNARRAPNLHILVLPKKTIESRFEYLYALVFKETRLSRPKLANVKFRGLANQHCHPLMEQRAAVRIAQLDIMGTGPKREFLRLLDPVCKSTIHVD